MSFDWFFPSFFSTILFHLLLLQPIFSCGPNGACGGNPGCISPPPPPLRGPPPSLIPCPTSGCGPSYGCGPYGCYRLRAHGAASFQPGSSLNSSMALHSRIKSFWDEDFEGGAFNDENWGAPDSAKEVDDFLKMESFDDEIRRFPPKYTNPNSVFMECCERRKLPDACLDKCNFGAFTKEALIRMFFRQDGCPLAAMRELQFCAAHGGDHRACCAQNYVGATLAGAKCLTFCDQRPGAVTHLDFSHVPCFERFDGMKNCFYQGIAAGRKKSPSLRFHRIRHPL